MREARVLQSGLRAVFPPACVACGEMVEEEWGLCPSCWGDTPFISGLTCDCCGTPLPGQMAEATAAACDDCARGRPWDKGAAAVLYTGTARRLVLSFKHGDRTDLARPLGRWMARVSPAKAEVVVPVPLHWIRLFQRRYNQAALLAREVGRLTHTLTCPDALTRYRRTPRQVGMTRQERFALQSGAIRPNPRRIDQVAGKSVLLVDDVMTTGATLSACAEALHRAGARQVDVLVLARADRDA